jgi:hypothetical protein
MLGTLKKWIFGVPQGETLTAVSSRLKAIEEPARYLPEHRLSEVERSGGIGPNGECWALWRTEANSGLRWFQRISDGENITHPATITGESDEPRPDLTPQELHQAFCRRQEARLQAFQVIEPEEERDDA